MPRDARLTGTRLAADGWMTWQPIRKEWDPSQSPPNLRDYSEACQRFDWQAAARTELSGLPANRGLNIAHECVDRHAQNDPARRDRIALRWLGSSGRHREISYRELACSSSRFAHALRTLGIGKGDRVFTLLGRIPELYTAALGTLKNRSVFCPLFSAFGPAPLLERMKIGEAKVLVTTETLFHRKIAPILERLHFLQHILIVYPDDRDDRGIPPRPSSRRIGPTELQDLAALLEQASPEFTIQETAPGDWALLHFTSGTTGRPKGAIHVHEAILAHHLTGKLALDFHADDVFWCTADPGWVTGTSYGIFSPLSNGITSVVDEADFDAERWYRILEQQRVTVWYTAPTAIRMLMKAGDELPRRFDLGRLRLIASVGEPLNPEAVVWGQRVLGRPIHDNWWQTETGGIMVSNFRSMDIRPGSMGKPLPGIEAAIARRTREGRVERVEAPGVQGELVLKAGWPSMFRGYLNEQERYERCFSEGYYFTGDLATRDSEGYFWFVGRADDVIKSAGHLIGPFEVESALMEHPQVAEAAVIGKPDPTVFEVVKAFIELKPGVAATEELRLDLLGFARTRLGPVVAPKQIEFRANIPKTRSGKIMRRLLKAQELGLPTGDTSTLESSA